MQNGKINQIIILLIPIFLQILFNKLKCQEELFNLNFFSIMNCSEHFPANSILKYGEFLDPDLSFATLLNFCYHSALNRLYCDFSKVKQFLFDNLAFQQFLLFGEIL